MGAFKNLALRLKSTIGTFSSEVEWYYRNGFYNIGSRLASPGGYTGRIINSTTAMKIAVVFGGVKIIAEDTASLPLALFETSPNGDVNRKAKDHPLYGVLHDSPNPEMTAIDMRGAVTTHALVLGNGYAQLIRRGKLGPVIEMNPLNSQAVTKDRDSKQKLFYVYKDGNSPEKTFDMTQMFELRGYSWNGQDGFSLIQQAMNALDLGMSAEEYAGNFFRNDGTPPIVLSYPGRLSPEEIKNAKNAWMKAQSGPGHQHEPAVAHGGMTVSSVAKSPEETQLTQARTFFIQEFCRVTRMPPHKLAELSHATFSNVEQQERSYYTNCLRLWLVRWEQAIYRCCLDVNEKTRYYAEHSAEALLRGDFISQTVGFSRMLEKGVYSINEVRAYLNLNPVPNGDDHYIQLNMQTVADAAAGLAGLDPSALTPPTEGGPQKSTVWHVEGSRLAQ